MSAALEFTGERFVPGTRGEIWMEHWHRYHFASLLAGGKRVVDAACGEGYGSALLARTASGVTGADISPEAIAHARQAYAGVANLSFVQAPCAKLPLADASADLFVTFETVEHIGEQEEFLEEIARVLVPGGLVLLSCPNKAEYSDRRGFANEFHVKELYRAELATLVARRFPHARWYGQRPSFFSVIAPEPGAQSGQLVEVSEADPASSAASLAAPLYFVVAASRSAAALEALPATLSVLADRDDWVHRDYEKVMRELGVTVERGESLERELARAALERDEALASRSESAARIAELQARLAESQRALAAGALALEEREREITRRGGLRWWIRLPFERLFGRASRG